MATKQKRNSSCVRHARHSILFVGLVFLLVAIALTGCDSAKSRAEAEAIRSDAHMRASATQQALDIRATVTAMEVQEDQATQPERIQNRERREWWINTILIGFVAGLAALAIGWMAGEVKARNTKAQNDARTYHPAPETGALPVVRLDHTPGKMAQFVHEAAPLIRLAKPSFVPKPLQYVTMLVDLDTGAQIRFRQVLDEHGRLHVWQETHLGPPGQHALAHHTRRVVTLGNAITDMKQRHLAAGEIAHAVQQVGYIPAFEPSYGSDNGGGRLIRLKENQDPP